MVVAYNFHTRGSCHSGMLAEAAIFTQEDHVTVERLRRSLGIRSHREAPHRTYNPSASTSPNTSHSSTELVT